MGSPAIASAVLPTRVGLEIRRPLTWPAREKIRKLAGLLRDIERLPLALDWDDIIQMQATCLRHGINKIGVPDLIIAQHARQNNLSLFSLDKHFALISKHVPLKLQ